MKEDSKNVWKSMLDTFTGVCFQIIFKESNILLKISKEKRQRREEKLFFLFWIQHYTPYQTARNMQKKKQKSLNTLVRKAHKYINQTSITVGLKGWFNTEKSSNIVHQWQSRSKRCKNNLLLNLPNSFLNYMYFININYIYISHYIRVVRIFAAATLNVWKYINQTHL